jgi:uncharacterized membrane protein (UPF0127 family)
MHVRVERMGSIVCERCLVAERMLARMRGLLGRRSLTEGEGLLLRRTGSIHTCFMRFPIDAVFLGRELEVLAVVANVKPWRVAGRLRARNVLELAAGAASSAGICAGDRLELVGHGDRRGS